jgi:UDP-glucose 6-dehydrogenase
VFNPEFLTEANYIDDFKNQNRIIIGGPRPASTIVKNMFRKVFQEVPIIKTGSILLSL